MLSGVKGNETQVLLNSRNVRNGVPRSIAIPVGNNPQANMKATAKETPENQFFLTSKVPLEIILLLSDGL